MGTRWALSAKSHQIEQPAIVNSLIVLMPVGARTPHANLGTYTRNLVRGLIIPSGSTCMGLHTLVGDNTGLGTQFSTKI